MGIVFESDAEGPKARAIGEWTVDDAEALSKSGVRRFEVGSGYGDLAFPFTNGLEKVDDLKVNHLALRSDGDVATLPDLHRLSLETYSSDAIDFRVFRRLERLHLNWRPNAESAFESASLRSLSVAGCPITDLNPLSRLSALEGLRLASARKLSSLDGIQRLPNLRTLRLLDDRALVDLSPLADSGSSLTELWLDGCRRVGAIDAVARHRELRRLVLADGGRIASLKPLAGLPVLEELYFYGSTIIEDGDMTPILALPALRRVAFAPRRHYTHREADLERLRPGLNKTDPMPHWRW